LVEPIGALAQGRQRPRSRGPVEARGQRQDGERWQPSTVADRLQSGEAPMLEVDWREGFTSQLSVVRRCLK
jgi:hypothetical protein